LALELAFNYRRFAKELLSFAVLKLYWVKENPNETLKESSLKENPKETLNESSLISNK